jgi:type IX secretion system PorP/SprF family membrane protein
MGIVKYIVLVLLVFGLHPLKAQFLPNTSQSFQFASGFNPSFAGVESQSDLKLGYRYQWAGFGDAAPKFINIGFNTRLKQPVDLITHTPRMSNARELNSAAFVPARKRTIHGFGVNFFHESNSLVVHTGGAVHYAFHYPVSRDVKLSVGASAVMESIKLDVNKIYLGAGVNPDEDPLYRRYQRDGASHLDFNARAGFLLYGKKFYLGATYLELFNKVLSSSTDSSDFSTLFYRGSAQGGLSFEAAPNVFIRPSFVALLDYRNNLSIDYSVKVYIQEKFWFGFMYRDVKSLVGLLGFNVNKTFGVAYGYEMSMGGMKKFNDGSHDLVLAMRFNTLKRPGATIW